MDELEIEKIFAIKRENFRISVECGRLKRKFFGMRLCSCKKWGAGRGRL